MELKFKINRLFGEYIAVSSTRNDRVLQLSLNELFKLIIQRTNNVDFINKCNKELADVVNEMEQNCRDIVVYCFNCDGLKSQVLCIEVCYNDKPVEIKYVTDENNEYSDTAMRDLTRGLHLYYDGDENCVTCGDVEITYISNNPLYSLNKSCYDDYLSVTWFNNQVFTSIDLYNLENNS